MTTKRNPKIGKRRLSRKVNARTVWRPSVTTAELSREDQTRAIAFSTIANLFDDHGGIKPLDALPPEIACTVAAVTRRRRPDGGENITIRMRDRSAALKRLLRLASGARTQRTQRAALPSNKKSVK